MPRVRQYTVPQWLTPVAIFTLAAAVMISAMSAAVLRWYSSYLVLFAIMFSAPAVGVFAFFAQGVDASDCCNFDWAPVVQTSSHFVVRGGEILFEAVQPSAVPYVSHRASGDGSRWSGGRISSGDELCLRCSGAIHTRHPKLRRALRTTSTVCQVGSTTYGWMPHNAGFGFLDRPPATHWVKFTFEAGFELPSSWPALPCYGPGLNRNILDFMK
jgi:hypothetical protein